jgi:hypothetical protein
MERSRQPEKKRRRLQLKEERATSKGANEAIEGVSYQSGTKVFTRPCGILVE